MEIATLILNYIEALIWPSVVIFLVLRFHNEIKGFMAKALRSHEVEVEILGQKIKLKALEKLSEGVPEADVNKDHIIEPSQNAFLTLRLFHIISKLSTDEVFMLRSISQQIDKSGYCGCEAERLVLEKFVELKIFSRDEKGFYHPTDIGKRLLLSLNSL